MADRNDPFYPLINDCENLTQKDEVVAFERKLFQAIVKSKLGHEVIFKGMFQCYDMMLKKKLYSKNEYFGNRLVPFLLGLHGTDDHMLVYEVVAKLLENQSGKLYSNVIEPLLKGIPKECENHPKRAPLILDLMKLVFNKLNKDISPTLKTWKLFDEYIFFEKFSGVNSTIRTGYNLKNGDRVVVKSIYTAEKKKKDKEKKIELLGRG